MIFNKNHSACSASVSWILSKFSIDWCGTIVVFECSSDGRILLFVFSVLLAGARMGRWFETTWQSRGWEGGIDTNSCTALCSFWARWEIHERIDPWSCNDPCGLRGNCFGDLFFFFFFLRSEAEECCCCSLLVDNQKSIHNQFYMIRFWGAT